MEDYKELIQRLHRHIMGDDYFNINSDFASAVVQAADAIEHLVKERDELHHILQTRPVKTEVITFDCCNDGTNWGW